MIVTSHLAIFIDTHIFAIIYIRFSKVVYLFFSCFIRIRIPFKISLFAHPTTSTRIPSEYFYLNAYFCQSSPKLSQTHEWVQQQTVRLMQSRLLLPLLLRSPKRLLFPSESFSLSVQLTGLLCKQHPSAQGCQEMSLWGSLFSNCRTAQHEYGGTGTASIKQYQIAQCHEKHTGCCF